MRIKRYIGKDVQEAMYKVKMDLGSNAVILNTKKVKQRGLKGLFAKPLTEILAAVDEEYEKGVKNKAEIKQPVAKQYSRDAKPIYDKSFTFENNEDKKINELENKVKNMESMINKIYESVSSEKNNQEEINIEENNEEMKESETQILDRFYKRLLDSDIEENIVKRIIDKAKAAIKDPLSLDEIYSVLHKIIIGALGEPEMIRLREDGKPTVVILIGPTGVGKTTTLAKIAADFSLNKGKNVALITADTYRIAAVEQLKTYAEILNMSVTVIYSPAELDDAIAENEDKDVIFIDTAGRSFKNKNQFDELKQLVEQSNADDVFLVLSATTGKLTLREILKNYSFMSNYKIIFTKLDETSVYGIIMNSRYMTGKPLSYITVGQSVPDDIELADVKKLAVNILGQKEIRH